MKQYVASVGAKNMNVTEVGVGLKIIQND
jgi:hypothetical protein